MEDYVLLRLNAGLQRLSIGHYLLTKRQASAANSLYPVSESPRACRKRGSLTFRTVNDRPEMIHLDALGDIALSMEDRSDCMLDIGLGGVHQPVKCTLTVWMNLSIPPAIPADIFVEICSGLRA